MHLNSAIVKKLGGLGAGQMMRWLISTLDTAIVYFDRSTDPAYENFRGPVIMLFWHEYIALPFCVRGHCDIAMLLSRHRDAEWLSWAARYMGFETIRGSTRRGGGTALRRLMEKGKSCTLAFTPDGPRGPRRQMAPGPIYVSSQLQIPLVPFGVGFDRPWRLNTWDRFAVPRPYSRGRVVMGPRVQIPPHVDREGIEHYRGQVEQLTERLTLEAEAWASAGSRKVGQVPLRPEPMPLLVRRRAVQQAGGMRAVDRSVLPLPGVSGETGRIPSENRRLFPTPRVPIRCA